MSKKNKKQKNQRDKNARYKAWKKEENKIKQRLGKLSTIECFVMLNRQSDNQSLHNADKAKLYNIQKDWLQELVLEGYIKPTRVIARDTHVVSKIKNTDVEKQYLCPSKKVSLQKTRTYRKLENKYYDLLQLASNDYLHEYESEDCSIEQVIGLDEYFDEKLCLPEIEEQILEFKKEFPQQDVDGYMQTFFEDLAEKEFVENARNLTQTLFKKILTEEISPCSAYKEMCRIGISFDFIGIDTTYTGKLCVTDKHFNDYHRQQLTSQERWIVELKGTIDGQKVSLYFPYKDFWLDIEKLPVEYVESFDICPAKKDSEDYPLDALAKKFGYKKKFPKHLETYYGSDYGSYPAYSPWKQH